MSGDFLSWWFDTHYIWSTILTPKATVLWLIFTDNWGWRMACVLTALFVCFVLAVFSDSK